MVERIDLYLYEKVENFHTNNIDIIKFKLLSKDMHYKIQIENKKGSYKSFGNDPNYPLKGVTYPVDYGYIEGYTGEDDDPLDIFIGNGNGKLFGYVEVWRLDVPKETKMFIYVTKEELEKILNAFKPVLKSYKILMQDEFDAKLNDFKNK